MNKPGNVVLFVIIAFYTYTIIINAWIGDDAFITMRTVDNFLNGYRLTWNVGERVQPYTHPLWMLVLLATHAFMRDPFASIYVVSIATSVITVIIVVTKIAKTAYAAAVAVAILTFSMAFIDYSTSGLENPLTHLLLAAFLAVYFKAAIVDERRLFVLSLIAAFAAVNRLDTLLFYIPSLAYSFWNLKSKKAVVAIALGFSPLALWEMFSIIYYGFPFPNTFYAKLGSGIDTLTLMKQGLAYYKNSLSWDPLTLTIIAAGVTSAFIIKERKGILVSAGILLYLFYVLRIGGDFMSGRFFSAALLGGVALILQVKVKIKQPVYVLAILGALVISLSTGKSPILTTTSDGKGIIPEDGVGNERLFYFRWTGLVNALRSEDFPNFDWVLRAKEYKESGIPVVRVGAVGFFGYYIGPDVYVIDKHALTDPLTARLPISDLDNWRIGHYVRDLPELYWKTLELKNKNRIQDPNLRAYYDKLLIVVRGDLFSWERLTEIWRFNTGYYDPLIKAYIETLEGN